MEYTKLILCFENPLEEARRTINVSDNSSSIHIIFHGIYGNGFPHWMWAHSKSKYIHNTYLESKWPSVFYIFSLSLTFFCELCTQTAAFTFICPYYPEHGVFLDIVKKTKNQWSDYRIVSFENTVYTYSYIIWRWNT